MTTLHPNGLGPNDPPADAAATERAHQEREERRRCPGRNYRDHVGYVCRGSCCTACGGPIDGNSECRCPSEQR